LPCIALCFRENKVKKLLLQNSKQGLSKDGILFGDARSPGIKIVSCYFYTPEFLLRKNFTNRLKRLPENSGFHTAFGLCRKEGFKRRHSAA
jgi:hypothetical protein